jgi:hypothetical protein
MMEFGCQLPRTRRLQCRQTPRVTTSHERYQITILLRMRGLPHEVSEYFLQISVGFAHFIPTLNFIKFFPFDEQKTTHHFVKLTATQPQLWRL